LWF
jgi:hypothetical protein